MLRLRARYTAHAVQEGGARTAKAEQPSAVVALTLDAPRGADDVTVSFSLVLNRFFWRGGGQDARMPGWGRGVRVALATTGPPLGLACAGRRRPGGCVQGAAAAEGHGLRRNGIDDPEHPEHGGHDRCSARYAAAAAAARGSCRPRHRCGHALTHPPTHPHER